jgi:hypothetical protein
MPNYFTFDAVMNGPACVHRRGLGQSESGCASLRQLCSAIFEKWVFLVIIAPT